MELTIDRIIIDSMRKVIYIVIAYLMQYCTLHALLMKEDSINHDWFSKQKSWCMLSSFILLPCIAADSEHIKQVDLCTHLYEVEGQN